MNKQHLIIKNLSNFIPGATNFEPLMAYLCTKVIDNLHDDPSNYASGRKIAWLMHEWSLLEKKWSSGYQDETLWKLCKRIWPEMEAALITKGGGIRPHRDDRYADFMACSLNLGPCVWSYRQVYPKLDRWTKEQDASAEFVDYELEGGEVIFFNCKNPHAVRCEDHRWSINMWRVSNKVPHPEQEKLF